MLLDDAINTFVAHLEDRALSRSYIESVTYRLGRLADSLPGVSLLDLEAGQVNRYFRDLKESGLSEATRAGHANSVRALLNFSVRQGFIPYSPAAGLPRMSYRPVHRRAASAASVGKLIAAIQPYAAHRNFRPRDVKDALAVSFAVDCGARLGEINSLRWADARHALAHGHETKNGRMAYQVIGTGKTGASVLRFFSETAELFHLWQRLNPWPQAVFVFASITTGEKMRASSLGDSFVRISKFAGIPPVRAQAIRKRNVTDIIQKTGDWKMGQLLAGHSDMKVTMEHYNDVDLERVDDAAAEMANLRRGGEGGHLLAASLFKK